ncbi:acyl carrier protein [Corynebacterium sanguinis]|uniref:Acyl carrier protein n=1 Tax=Corynebacterium sanguinis TaxID=2594913 RepID=A0A6C1U148_9CORY|nr:acyl carrier protein [Corynebacterium sanguinis]MCT1491314.1 acyl carrier protein [Corynebacterium sanguinis]MCT1614789.1 acyl carrier protein [Corynebacterium sanguinis]MCT1881844.1 acyl carrier protein [Corynebacterium sanguinis]MCT2246767.1 acyl carrier protein [Corynebacterium sanguinis]MDN8622568.1 acyl carrier protein [Corynebacterium sanguinis]
MKLSQRLDLGALNLEAEEPTDRSLEARLIDLVSRITGDEVDPAKTLAELGISSLDRIELAVRAEEEFGVLVDDSLYTDSLTVNELAASLAQASE